MNFSESLAPTKTDNNPFVIGLPITTPRQFFGREQILKRIFDVWRSPPLQHIGIIGVKRSGKTSLLHYLSRIIDTPSKDLRPNQRNDWIKPLNQWVYIDFQDARMCYQESLLQHILSKIGLPTPQPCDLFAFTDIIDQYLDIPTIILLDEIKMGFDSPDLDDNFWWGMRSLGCGGKLGYVLTAHKAPEDMLQDDGQPSPFFNIFGHLLNLNPFTEDEALDFISSIPQIFDKKDIEWIINKSAKWPFLLQMICHSRFTALKEGQKDNAWKLEALQAIKRYRYLL
ncbi:ATP-binding protein [Candidatus Marithrix sp. Canyon 246]|uniref:ATP-binding protein n=1 Tax=Candidatus Marithrix sp. Canyon 246 TaxID=1827136 RepID=UPI000B053685|nr:ATP-binding protein [Candidatus Marithrix sp. Canyon 246]